MIFTAVLKSQYKLSIFSPASRELSFLIKEDLWLGQWIEKSQFSEKNNFMRSQIFWMSFCNAPKVQHPFYSRHSCHNAHPEVRLSLSPDHCLPGKQLLLWQHHTRKSVKTERSKTPYIPFRLTISQSRVHLAPGNSIWRNGGNSFTSNIQDSAWWMW